MHFTVPQALPVTRHLSPAMLLRVPLKIQALQYFLEANSRGRGLIFPPRRLTVLLTSDPPCLFASTEYKIYRPILKSVGPWAVGPWANYNELYSPKLGL